MPARHESYTVVSLRPVDDHAALRRAAAAQGWRTVALSPWRIVVRDDDATRAALRTALTAAIVIATSPAAARAAAALMPLRQRRGQIWCAVGSSTAATLRRAGIAKVQTPTRMDSEGLLALPVLGEIDGCRIALLTAPGGRDRIAPGLRARGAVLQRVDVYARVPIRPRAATLARIRSIPGRWLVPLSSGEALQHMLDTLPNDMAARLREACIVAASPRLVDLARNLGCNDVRLAAGPRPRQLLAAVAADR